MKKLIKRSIDHDAARVRKHPIFWMYASFASGIMVGYVLAQPRLTLK